MSDREPQRLTLSACPRCRGIGRVVADHVQTCSLCEGTGQVPEVAVRAYEAGLSAGSAMGRRTVHQAVEEALRRVPA